MLEAVKAVNQSGVAQDTTEARLRPRGSNHVGMRQFNERVVLQAIRLHGSVAKAEIARLTRLTPQTVQIIIARLGKRACIVNPKKITMSDTVAVMTGAMRVDELPADALA